MHPLDGVSALSGHRHADADAAEDVQDGGGLDHLEAGGQRDQDPLHAWHAPVAATATAVCGDGVTTSRSHRAPSVFDARESHARVVLSHQRVLRGGDVMPEDARLPKLARERDHVAEQRVLDGAPEDATAHDPGVDVERVVVLARDQDRDDAAIREAVAQPDEAGVHARRLHHAHDLALGVASPRQVELVRPVDQLDDARQVRRVEGADVGAELQALEELVERAVGGERAPAGPIVVRPGAVFVGERRHVEPASVRDGADELARVHRHADDVDLGHREPHLGALARIVVDEDERVEVERQLGGDLLQVDALRLPVDADRGEVVPGEDHLGMAFEG